MTTTTTKTANYSAEQENAILAAAAEAGGKIGAELATELAAQMGKSAKSLIAKASRLGVYQAAVRTRKDGSPVVKKDDTATAIGRILGLSEPDVDSLTKANRRALMAIFEALANSRPIDGAN